MSRINDNFCYLSIIKYVRDKRTLNKSVFVASFSNALLPTGVATLSIIVTLISSTKGSHETLSVMQIVKSVVLACAVIINDAPLLDFVLSGKFLLTSGLSISIFTI